MGDNVSSADNQQGSRFISSEIDPSETTRRAPFSEGEVKAYLLGSLHDATFSSNKRFRFSQKGTEWLLILKHLLQSIGYNSWIYQEGKSRSVYVLETLASFLDFKCNPLEFKTTAERISYVRGFFDAEGGIPKNGKRFYIQLVQKDKPKLEKLKRILSAARIQTGKIHNPSREVDPEYWRMYVLSGSHTQFARIVGSWHPRKSELLRKRMKI